MTTEWADNSTTDDLLQRYRTGTYARRNAVLAAWVAESGPRNIIEVAAGCYDLASQIVYKATPRAYTWTDGDATCVEACRPYLKGAAMVRQMDASSITAETLRIYDTVICVSTEHLPGDVEMVSSARPGAQVFLCGATFPSRWHLRHWDTLSAFVARYSGALHPRRMDVVCPPGQMDLAAAKAGELPFGSKLLLWGERRK